MRGLSRTVSWVHGSTDSSFFFFLMIRRPRRSPLFPYTPLFRSLYRPQPMTIATTASHNKYRIVVKDSLSDRTYWIEKTHPTHPISKRDEALGGSTGSN